MADASFNHPDSKTGLCEHVWNHHQGRKSVTGFAKDTLADNILLHYGTVC